ncbi:structural cement protein Gp24 [Borrelia hispanica]|uniref:structural cement protein Gp24 n=1 Tax=Borrelia hispanica TaxID=40835 RepID=UPI001F4337F1|nr:hypothetical protein [Borrelia hispanica]
MLGLRMHKFSFSGSEKSFLPGFEHKSGIHETESAIVDADSEAILPGDLVIVSKSSNMGDILVKKATSSTTNTDVVRGFAMKKTYIPSYETEKYLPGEVVPIRRRGEVVVTLDTSYTTPKIGHYVFLKDGKLVQDKNGKGGVQVGRIKDISISTSSKVVLLDVQIGHEYDTSGNRKFSS